EPAFFLLFGNRCIQPPAAQCFRALVMPAQLGARLPKLGLAFVHAPRDVSRRAQTVEGVPHRRSSPLPPAPAGVLVKVEGELPVLLLVAPRPPRRWRRF